MKKKPKKRAASKKTALTNSVIDSESPELDRAWFSRAKRMSQKRRAAAVEMPARYIPLDSDVLKFFERGTGNVALRVNKTLRAIIDAVK